MSLKKVGDISAPINYYVDRTTQEKKKFCRVVGSLLQNEHGLTFVSLNQDFNLLGCLHDPEKGSVLLQVINEDGKPLDPPNEQNKPVSPQAKHSGEPSKKTQKPSAEAIRNAKKLLQADARAKQNITKDGKYIDLPFDDDIPPFN